MKQTFKKYFVPHAENNYHPHILHTKRAVLYSVLFIAMKGILLFFVLLLPATAFMLPEILQEEQAQVISLTNQLREEAGKTPLSLHQKLVYSAGLKATDMAEKQYFSHVSPEDNGLAYFLGQAGYSYKVAGENLGMGFSNAQELVAAWVKSPTHYKNIIDTDFLELGVNLSEGLYEDIPTVYVVQHFGLPKQIAVVAAAEPVPTTTPMIAEESIAKPALSESVESVGETKPLADTEMTTHNLELVTSSSPIPPALVYNQENSKLRWRENSDGSIHLTPEVYIKGEIKEISIEIEKNNIDLQASTIRDGDFTMYTAEADIPFSTKEIFSVILPVTLRIIGGDGIEILDTLAWDNPKIISPDPIEKYTEAQKKIPFISSVFNFAKSVYIIALIFFSLVLILSIGIEIKRQHPHIIVQTLALLCLLVVLIIS